MGLEIVELIMRVEEEFEIEILDHEAEQLATPGALSRLVSWKLGVSASQVCLSSAAFYQTRRALVASVGATRSQIRPRTELETLLPARNRRKSWARLGAQLRTQSGAVLPKLRLPEWLHGAIVLGAALPWTLSFVCLAATEVPVAGALLAGGAGYLWLAFTLAKPWARGFPASCQSAGALSALVLVSSFKAAPASPLEASASATEVGESEIWKMVRLLIADELGVPLEIVTPDADFVRDLGVG